MTSCGTYLYACVNGLHLQVVTPTLWAGHLGQDSCQLQQCAAVQNIIAHLDKDPPALKEPSSPCPLWSATLSCPWYAGPWVKPKYLTLHFFTIVGWHPGYHPPTTNRASDISPKPGPPTYICPLCQSPITKKIILRCNSYYHQWMQFVFISLPSPTLLNTVNAATTLIPPLITLTQVPTFPSQIPNKYQYKIH